MTDEKTVPTAAAIKPPAPAPVPQASGTANATQKAADTKVIEPGDKVAAPSTSYPGFPKTKYHPVYGGREIKTPNDEASLQPAHDWFDTPGEADMHRTDREAQLAIHHNRRLKIDDAESPIVRNSVQATEAIAAGQAEPL